MGLVLTLRGFTGLKSWSPLVGVPWIFFGCLFAYSVVVGLFLSEGANCRRQLLLLYGFQLFSIYSPLLTYHCHIGVDAMVGVRSWQFLYDLVYGVSWFGGILEPQPWGIGINLFALSFIIIEVAAWIRQAPAISTSDGQRDTASLESI